MKGRTFGKMFTYIKPEFMISAFTQQRDSLTGGRTICVARLGDFAVSMEKIDSDSFSLCLENVVTGAQHAGKIFNITMVSQEEVTPIVEKMFHKMQSIYEKQVFDRRECIWKWYAMGWLEEQDISLDEYLESRMLSNSPDNYVHWKTFEEYMGSDYLNVASTMDIIERFASSEEEIELYKTFAVRDIVELRQKKSLEAILQHASDNIMIDHRKVFSFGVDVIAESRVEAREKLKALLSELDEGEFFIRG